MNSWHQDERFDIINLLSDARIISILMNNIMDNSLNHITLIHHNDILDTLRTLITLLINLVHHLLLALLVTNTMNVANINHLPTITHDLLPIQKLV
jgi:hypothetical protein